MGIAILAGANSSPAISSVRKGLCYIVSILGGRTVSNNNSLYAPQQFSERIANRWCCIFDFLRQEQDGRSLEFVGATVLWQNASAYPVLIL